MKMIEWLIAQYKLEVKAKTEVPLYPHVLLVLVTNHSTQVDSVHLKCSACASGLLYIIMVNLLDLMQEVVECCHYCSNLCIPLGTLVLHTCLFHRTCGSGKPHCFSLSMHGASNTQLIKQPSLHTVCCNTC